MTAFGVHVYCPGPQRAIGLSTGARCVWPGSVKTALKWAVVLLLGLGLFGWFIHRAGPGEILANMSRLGWLMPVVVMPYFLVYVLDAWGWHSCPLAAYATVRPGYLTLFRVRWAAESINTVIPSAYVGGEALKVYSLLHKRGLLAGMTASTSVVTVQDLPGAGRGLLHRFGALAATTVVAARGWRPRAACC